LYIVPEEIMMQTDLKEGSILTVFTRFIPSDIRKRSSGESFWK